MRTDGWVVARPVLQFATIGLVVLAVVGLATAAASRQVGQREAIADARTTTLIKAQDLVQPVVANGLAAGNATAVSAVADVVEGRVISGSLVRVKIWNGDGVVVYSNEHRLLGSTYPLGADKVAAFRTGAIAADVSDLKQPENQYERPFGKLLEVYVPMRAPNGEPVLFEAYYRFNSVAASGGRIWRDFAPITLGALVVLELFQIPLAWSLGGRLRRRQQEREALLERAMEASDVERRRIASDLHDGVVQDLVGVAYALAGSARDAGTSPRAAEILDSAANSLRGSITALRSTLVDIYPPDLAQLGLSAALDGLATDSSSEHLSVAVDATALAEPVSPPVAALLYRAAREALRNVVRHAGASTAVIRTGSGNGHRVWIEVRDNGSGFDPATLDERAAAGHFGLKGLEGLVSDAGGLLTIDSTRAVGTTLRVEVVDR